MSCFVCNKIEKLPISSKNHPTITKFGKNINIDAGNANAEFKFDYRDSSRFTLQCSLRQLLKGNEITFKMIPETLFYVEFYWWIIRELNFAVAYFKKWYF